MALPIENMLAFYPRPIEAAGMSLGPLTIEGAVALESLGIDTLQREVPQGLILVAVAVLADGGRYVPEVMSGRYDFKRLARRLKNRLDVASDAVNAVIRAGWTTYIKPMKRNDGVKHMTPHGLGWPLELAEALCEIYSWPWFEVAAMPLARAWALIAANRQYNGGSHGGFDYIERAYIEDLKAKKKAEAKNG